jgi:hypothetical protein
MVTRAEIIGPVVPLNAATQNVILSLDFDE